MHVGERKDYNVGRSNGLHPDCLFWNLLNSIEIQNLDSEVKILETLFSRELCELHNVKRSGASLAEKTSIVDRDFGLERVTRKTSRH